MHNIINIIRWILVIPFAFIGWYCAVFIGLFLYNVAESFCPPELVVSGVCTASWSVPVKNGIIISGAGISAILAILFSVVMAPCKRKLVAKTIYLGGFAFAIYAVYATKAWWEFVTAIICGALFLLVVLHYLNGKDSAYQGGPVRTSKPLRYLRHRRP